MIANYHVTTTTILICTGILLVIDISLTWIASRLINREQFRSMSRLLAITSGLFYLVVWVTVLWWGWDWFYSYIFPEAARYILPFVFWIGYTLLGFGMSWLCLKLPGNPALTWCVLGGLEGLLSHIYAIYGLGAASKPPIMQGSDPWAVLIFAIFEKAFYWGFILLGCKLIGSGMHKKVIFRPGSP